MSKRLELGSDNYKNEFQERINNDTEYAELAASVDDSYPLVLQAEPDK